MLNSYLTDGNWVLDATCYNRRGLGCWVSPHSRMLVVFEQLKSSNKGTTTSAGSASVTVGSASLPTSRTRRLWSGSRGLLHQGPGLGGDAQGRRVQHGHGGDDGAALRAARRRLRGTEPGDQRLAEVERRRYQDHLGCRHRRRLDRGQGGISSAAQLKGKTLATPSLGNTQDVALRSWLRAGWAGHHRHRRRRRLRQADHAELGRRAGVQVRADRRRLRARAL